MRSIELFSIVVLCVLKCFFLLLLLCAIITDSINRLRTVWKASLALALKDGFDKLAPQRGKVFGWGVSFYVAK